MNDEQLTKLREEGRVWAKEKYIDDENCWAMAEEYFVSKVTEAYLLGRSEAVEPIAKAIYDQMSYTENGVKPEWVVGGNSLKQDEARAIARKAITITQLTEKQ